MSKKILIIGNSANAYALAKKLSYDNEVFVAPGSDTISEFATSLDIRETSISEILEFAMENGIDLTIPVSKKTLDTNIVEVFQNNSMQIFVPPAKASKLVLDKALMKKVLYKLRIPTPKFAIFEKQNMVMDYIKNQKVPFVIKTNEPSSAVVLTSANTAKTIVDTIFAQKVQKVIIEDYVYGTPFSFYALTDGYKALPLGSAILYKHSLEGDGGQLTSGMGACSPNYKMSLENEYFLMDNVIYPVLDYFEIEGNPYLGIIGINGVLTEDGKIQILGFEAFMQDSDADAVLANINSDLYKLFESCVIGSFSDEIDFIPQKNTTLTSVVLVCKNKNNEENVISGIDSLDEDTIVSFYPAVNKNKYLEYETKTGPAMVVTATSSVASSSIKKVYSEIENISFNGMFYRKDICRPNFRQL